MKRFFLTLLLLPSIGICANSHYHDYPFPEIAQAATSRIHSHERLNNPQVITRSRQHRTHIVHAPSYRRYYYRHYRHYPRYLPPVPYFNHYHEHMGYPIYNNHVHGHE
ncbi:hypothetical protein ACNVED_10950 [Legionella sp. D16C41]|uniref:hypothetical protein n=1 Tax=Legionella sp. D16C41 TaxID=3402688 RepID=UPI003AF6670F